MSPSFLVAAVRRPSVVLAGDLLSTITPSPFVSTPIFKQLVTSCGSSGGSVAPFSVVRLNAKLRRTSYSVACVSFVHVSTNVINRCPRGMKGVGCRYHCYSCVAPREIGRSAPAHSHQVINNPGRNQQSRGLTTNLPTTSTPSPPQIYSSRALRGRSGAGDHLSTQA